MGTQVEDRQPPVWRLLGRHVRLLAAAALAGGLLGGVLALRTPATYEATRVIVSSDPDAVPETLGRLTQTVATTDTVLEPVISRLGLSLSTSELLESEMLKVEPVTNAAAIRMVARSTDPRLAFDLAKLSAESFVSVARDRGLGAFEVFGNDVLPTDAERPSLALSALLGMAAGGLVVFLVLLLASFFRDPVVSEREAGAEVGAADSFAIRMSAPSVSRRRASWEVRPAGVIAAVWRALGRTSASPPGGMMLTCLLIERRKVGDPWLIPLVERLAAAAREITEVRVRKVVVYRWPFSDDDEEMLASLESSDAVLLLVSEGARRRHLQDLVEILPGRVAPVLGLVTPAGLLLPRSVAERATRPAASPGGEAPAPARGAEEASQQVRTRRHLPDDGGERSASGNGWGRDRPQAAPPAPTPTGLAARLADPVAAARLEALSEVGSDPEPDVAAAVETRLTDPDPAVREACVSALARMRGERAAGLLVAALWSGDQAVRARARAEIGRSGSLVVAGRLVEHLGHSKERFVDAGSLLIEMGATGREALSSALPIAEGVTARAIRALLDSMESGAAPGVPVRESPDDAPEDAGPGAGSD